MEVSPYQILADSTITLSVFISGKVFWFSDDGDDPISYQFGYFALIFSYSGEVLPCFLW